MGFMRFISNLMALVVELALIAGVAWVGWRYPLPFAIATGLIGLALGLAMEQARLANELAFYLEGERRPRPVFIGTVAVVESAVKGLVGALAALLTFSGTDQSRLFWVAVVFAVALFGGTSLLRRLRLTLGARPARWGYFRLAAPMGLLFSAGMAVLVVFKLIPAASLGDLTRRMVFDTPQRPSIPQASELLFLFKQYFDEVIVSLLSVVLGREWAQAAGVLLSVNMLTGFVVAIYAVMIADLVRRVEEG